MDGDIYRKIYTDVWTLHKKYYALMGEETLAEIWQQLIEDCNLAREYEGTETEGFATRLIMLEMELLDARAKGKGLPKEKRMCPFFKSECKGSACMMWCRGVAG